MRPASLTHIDLIDLSALQILEDCLEVVVEARKTYESIDSDDFIKQSPVLAQKFPLVLRVALAKLRAEQIQGLLISGYPIKDLEKTPSHWNDLCLGTTQHEFYFFLLATLLGDPFTFVSEQGGKLIHDIIPIEGHRGQLSTSSDGETIFFHTEDSFSIGTDYIGLFCLRNEEAAETTIGTINADDLENLEVEDRESLASSEHSFILDLAHSSKSPLLSKGCRRRGKPSTSKAPVLSQGKYIRFDPSFMDLKFLDAKEKKAVSAMSTLIESRLEKIILRPGDILFLDNYLSVHGRCLFQPLRGGSRRWIKRIRVTQSYRNIICFDISG